MQRYTTLVFIIFTLFVNTCLQGQSNLQQSLEQIQRFESLRQMDSVKHYSEIAVENISETDESKYRYWFLNYYAFSHFRKEQEKSLEMALEALEGFKRLKNDLGIIKTSNTLGNIYYYTVHDIPKSTAHFEEALALLDSKKKFDFSDSIRSNLSAQNYNNLAINYKGIGDYEQAMVMATKANERLEEYGNDYLKALTLMNLANLNFQLKSYEKSIEINKELLVHSQKMNNTAFVSMAINNIAGGFGTIGQMDSSIYYLQQSYELSKELKDWRAVSLRAANLGFAYSELGQFEISDDFLKEALEIARKYNIPDREITALNFMAGSYIKQKKPNEAIEILDVISEKAKAAGDLNKLINSYELYYKAYQFKGDYKNALEYYRQYSTLSDSIKSEKVLTQVAELQTKYETEKKEKENVELRQQAKIDKLKLNRRNIAIALSILVLSLLSLLIFQYGRQRSLKAEQKALISNQQLKRAQLNPHFFFNALNSIQKLVATSSNKGEQIRYIAKFSKLMRQTLEQSFNEFVELEEEIESIENYMTLQQLRFKNRFEYQIENEFEGQEIYIPTQLLQPFVENAIEHGFKGVEHQGRLQIHFRKEENDVLKIEILDNGKGLGSTTSEHKSRAQEIIKERLSLFNDDKKYYFTLENQIVNKQTIGTKAVIYAPFQLI